MDKAIMDTTELSWDDKSEILRRLRELGLRVVSAMSRREETIIIHYNTDVLDDDGAPTVQIVLDGVLDEDEQVWLEY